MVNSSKGVIQMTKTNTVNAKIVIVRVVILWHRGPRFSARQIAGSVGESRKLFKLPAFFLPVLKERVVVKGYCNIRIHKLHRQNK